MSTPVDHSVRTELAKSYLLDANRSIIDTAFLVGFNDPSNFARAFKRWTDQSPTEYRGALPLR